MDYNDCVTIMIETLQEADKMCNVEMYHSDLCF